MARTTQLTENLLQQARSIRDNAHRASEVIKSLAVLLPAEMKLSAKNAAQVLGACSVSTHGRFGTGP